MALKRKGRGRIDETGGIEHQRLTSLINSMADAVLAIDEDCKIVLYNAAALNIFDLNNIRTGARLARLLKPINKDNQTIEVEKLVQAAKVPATNRDLRLKYSDGSIINLYISIAPVRLGYGEKGQSGWVLLLRDITREKSLEEERDEFISVVSHELRTPIAISEGNVSNAQFIVERSGDIKAIKQALAETHNQILFLADMINDLSTLSRAERGVLKVEVEDIDVPKLVEELVHNYTPSAQKKGLEVRSKVDRETKVLKSTTLYVREILQNFITNSVKYTESGFVLISAKNMPKGVMFTVHDTGIGISKSDQERVFDKFFRSEDYRTRAANGTGLGLYVTMKLASLIHAEITVESELNKGSAFHVFMPNLG